MKMKSILSKNKKGMGIGDIYPVVLTIAIVGILLGVVLYVLANFQTQLLDGTATTDASNATGSIIDAFVDFIPWVGIILLIVAAAIVLGIVINSFAGGAKRV